MDKLSQIAQEYLENYEVLRIARSRFDSELADWWRTLVKEYLRPSLSGWESARPIYDKSSQPGHLEVRTPGDNLFVRIFDPHHNGTRDYHVAISGNQRCLKKLQSDTALIEKLQSKADLGYDQLFPTNYALLEIPIAIQGDKPEETFKQVRDTMLELLKVADEIESRLQDEQ